MDTRSWDEGLRNVKKDGLGFGAGEGSDPKTLLERDGLKWRESLSRLHLRRVFVQRTISMKQCGVNVSKRMTPTQSLHRHQRGQSLVMPVGVKVDVKQRRCAGGAGNGEVKALILPSALFEY